MNAYFSNNKLWIPELLLTVSSMVLEVEEHNLDRLGARQKDRQATGCVFIIRTVLILFVSLKKQLNIPFNSNHNINALYYVTNE